MLTEGVTTELIVFFICFIVSQLFVAGAVYGGFRVGISSLCRRVSRIEDWKEKVTETELDEVRKDLREERAKMSMQKHT